MLANQWPTWAGRQELQVCDHQANDENVTHSLIPPKPKSFKLKGWTEKIVALKEWVPLGFSGSMLDNQWPNWAGTPALDKFCH
jgi:hypothetical protein